MRGVLLAFLLAACLPGVMALTAETSGSPVPAALGAVALGVLAASGVYGAVSWSAIALGALSPLAFAWLSRQVPGHVAIAILCLAWLAPRWSLTRERRHLVAAVVSGSAASWLAGVVVSSFAGDRPALRFTAGLFAGAALAMATELVPTDTPIASALASAASAVAGTTAQELERAAELHRRLTRVPGTAIDAGAFRALVEQAEKRAALRDAEGEDAEAARTELDAAIAKSVAGLVAGARGPSSGHEPAGNAEQAGRT